MMTYDALIVVDNWRPEDAKKAFSGMGTIKIVTWGQGVMGTRTKKIILTGGVSDSISEINFWKEWAEHLRCRLVEPPHDQIYRL